MTWSLKHKFHSAKTDGPDSTLIKPSNWNDEHDLEVDDDAVVLGRSRGEGAGPVQQIPMSSLIEPGFGWPFFGDVVPAGWYEMDGSLKNRLTDAALFAAIGTKYGAGDGSTTFRLPDARGVGLVGFTQMGGTPDRGNLPGGNVMGAYLGAPSVGGLPVSVSVSGGVSVGVSGGISGTAHANATAGSGSGAGPMCGDNAPVDGSFSGSGTGSFSGSGTGGTTAGFSVVQPSLVVRWCIKA